MQRCVATIILGLWAISTIAQRLSLSDFAESLLADDYAEEMGWTEQMEELQALYENPIDINTATPDQLRQIPFLNEQQIEDIIQYAYLQRGFRSLSELMAIPSINARTRQWLMLFLYAGQDVFDRKDTITFKRLMANSKHQVLTRLDIPLYYRTGYSYAPDAGGYHGAAIANKVQYTMTSMNHLSLGLLAEQDAGEPFRHNRGWDNYGFSLKLSDIRHLQTLVVGDYKLGFGEGLVVNNGFSFSKQMVTSTGIKARTSTDEYRYLRGAATALSFRHTTVSVWLSHRKLDASLDVDGNAVTIQTSGLHRTTTELSRKSNLHSTTTGADVTWRAHGLSLGATGYFQHFNRTLEPGTALYRRYYPRGNDFGVLGLHYGYKHTVFNIQGETAYSTEHNGLATLHRASWRASSRYSLSASHRFYSYRFYSFYASSLSENSNVQNESGAMLKLDAQPLDPLLVTVYADWFHNPFPRYGLSHGSSGFELSANAEWKFNSRNSLVARYQLKQKEQSDLMLTHHRLRLQWIYSKGQWQSKSAVALHAVGTKGYAVSESVKYQSNNRQWHVACMATWFRTDYQSRIYLYEPSLLRTMYMPQLYGHGARFVSTVRWQHSTGKWMAEMKYGGTRYFDRDTQSSGMQQILSPWKNDISLQVVVKI